MYVIFHIAAICLCLLLGLKIAVSGDWSAALCTIVALAIALYSLFLLEGIQVAGLRIKESEAGPLGRALEEVGLNRSAKERALKIFHVFSTNFDAFVTGRQILVIATVVFLNQTFSGIPVPPAAPAWMQPEGLDPAFTAVVLSLLRSGVLSFLLSTFITVWLSQLLPQFLADNRPLSFLKLPFAFTVVKITEAIDRVCAGAPAKLLQRLINRGSDARPESVPINRDKLFEAAVDLYGKGIRDYQLDIVLREIPEVQESWDFIFSSGPVSSIVYKFSLSEPIEGHKIAASLRLPDGMTNIAPKVSADLVRKKVEYRVRVPFSDPLPRSGWPAETAGLTLKYSAPAYRPLLGENLLEIRPFLVMNRATITIKADGKHVICDCQVQLEDSVHDPNAGAIKPLDDENGVLIDRKTNYLKIVIQHPAVGAVYCIRYRLEEHDTKPYIS